MYYAKSTGGFYSIEINGANIPADAVPITEAQHADLLIGQSQGKQIVGDASGNPILQTPLPPDPAIEKQALLTEARANREILLGRLYGALLKAMLANDSATIAAIQTAIQALENIMSDPRIVAAVDGAVKPTMLLVYGEIVTALATAAPAVVLSIQKLDQI